MGSTPLSGVLETLATIGFKNKFGILNFWVILMVVMKQTQNNKTQKDFKLKKQSKGWYVAQGVHKGWYFRVDCFQEMESGRTGFDVNIECEDKTIVGAGQSEMRLKDVRWQLANNRDWFLGMDILNHYI